jgi:formate-dependent nitrite reductase cytochrome c552 subunit
MLAINVVKVVRFQIIASLFLAGCNRAPDPRAETLVPKPPASAPAKPTEIHQSPKLSGIPTDARDPLGRPLRVACVTCHSMRTPETLPASTNELDEFHVGMKFQHGTLTCASCHTVGKQEQLRLADGRTIAMADAMTLCSQCHGPTRRSFDRGAHGGMTGVWSTQHGRRVRNQCVDCHDPHVPAYVPGRPVPPPRDKGTSH